MFPNTDLSDIFDLLVSNKQIVLDSSANTIQLIAEKQNRRNYQQNGVIPKVPSQVNRFLNPVIENIAPLNLLHSIGVITTPIVPNLVDISSTWAIIRYFWAFENNSPRLQLSHVAKNIDFHQKGLLSDELGVGMVHLVMNRFFNARSHLDVDILLQDPQIAFNIGFPQMVHNGAAKPDYIFIDNNGTVSIVESKGTQSGNTSSFDQIRRGLEQVPSIRFGDGSHAVEYVIATSITEYGTTVYVIDPPLDDMKKNKEDSKRSSYQIDNKEILIQTTRKIQAAKMLAFAGCENSAAEVSGIKPKTGQVQKDIVTRKEIPNLNTSFIGQNIFSSIRGSNDQKYSVFLGIEENLYNEMISEAFIHNDIQNLQTPIFAQHFNNFQETRIVDNDQTIFSVDKNGTIFYISLIR